MLVEHHPVGRIRISVTAGVCVTAGSAVTAAIGKCWSWSISNEVGRHDGRAPARRPSPMRGRDVRLGRVAVSLYRIALMASAADCDTAAEVASSAGASASEPNDGRWGRYSGASSGRSAGGTGPRRLRRSQRPRRVRGGPVRAGRRPPARGGGSSAPVCSSRSRNASDACSTTPSRPAESARSKGARRSSRPPDEPASRDWHRAARPETGREACATESTASGGPRDQPGEVVGRVADVRLLPRQHAPNPPGAEILVVERGQHVLADEGAEPGRGRTATARRPRARSQQSRLVGT